MTRTVKVIVALGVAGIAVGISAQQAPFTRTILQQMDISVTGREAVTAVAEFQPGATVPRHSHPGEEIGYILEGTVVVTQDGGDPVTLTVGQTFLIPSGVVHSATNTGSGRARLVATYVVEKGQPLATPAP